MTYVITGATGNTGSKVSNLLLNEGKKIRVIGRKAILLKIFTDRGAEAFVGDIKDSTFLTKSLEGADALYALIPPDYSAANSREYQNIIADSYFESIKESGIKNVVALSSVGAHVSNGTGILLGLFDFEQKLSRLENVNLIILRGGYFMENLLGSIGMIKSLGIFGSSFEPEFKYPAVASKDVAETAVKYLLKLDFSGKKVQFVLGPKDVDSIEVARIFGNAIGKPDLKYVQFSYEDISKTLQNYGFSVDSANAMVQMQRKFNEGVLYDPSDRNEENTTATTVEEFSKTFAMFYNS